MSIVVTNDFKSSAVYMDATGLWKIQLLNIPITIPDAIIVNGKGVTGAVAGSSLQAAIDLLATNKSNIWPIKPGVITDFQLSYYETGGIARLISIDLTKTALVLIQKAVYKSTFIPPVNTFVSSNYNLLRERLPYDTSYFVYGTVTKVKDGDTIEMHATSWGTGMNGHVPANGILTLRFAGMNAAEIRAHDPAYGNAGNGELARTYNITLEKAYDIADEATQLVTDIVSIGNKDIVVDIDTVNGAIHQDPYARLIAMIYKADAVVPDPGSVAININKTLISNASILTGSTIVPLARAYASTDTLLIGTRFTETQLWQNWIQAGNTTAEITPQIDAYEKQQADLLAEERKKLSYTNDQSVMDYTNYIIIKGDTLDGLAKSNNITVDALIAANNTTLEDLTKKLTDEPGASILIPYIKLIKTTPLDTEFQVKHIDEVDNSMGFFDAVDDRREMTSPYHLRIGDVQFVVPPLSIQYDRSSNLQKVKALRTKSSIITKGNGDTMVLTLQLYFHDLESINGYKVQLTNGGFYHMDGLRSLIAQFKKAPFLPIENDHINQTLDIQSVALSNMSVTTVPGFPHSLSVTLTMMKFQHEAYMPKTAFLDEVINYPMFRWYYQDVMSDKNKNDPYRTYLARIEGPLTNDFNFTIAKEEQLRQRQDAVNNIRFQNSPPVYDDKMQNGTTELAKFKRDGDRIKAALAQMDKFNTLKNSYIACRQVFPDVIKTDDDMFKQIYSDNKLDPDGSFIPGELIKWEIMTANPDFINQAPNPTIHIKIESTSSKSRIDPKYKLTGDLYALPPDHNNEAVTLLIQRADQINFEMRTYKYNWNQIQQQAIATEGTLDMDDYFISGLYITSIQVMYENMFSSAQLLNLDTPTIQFLGAQDPYIQITMETNQRQAVEDLQALLDKTLTYSKTYRYGITSGFLGIKNQLTALVGITTIMPEHVKISTVPGFPDRYQIEMSIVGFNKTQKRSETLTGLMSTNADVTKEQRSIDNQPVQADAVILERKMRDLEVYPDLELPTYEELNKALATINAGIVSYHNPTGAKFLDPDFYMAAKWTFRQDIIKQRGQNHSLTIKDLSGIVGKVSSISPNVFDASAESIPILDTIDSYSKTIKAQLEPNIKTPTDYTTSTGSNASSSSASGQSVGDWSSNLTNISTPPSYASWLKWTGGFSVDQPAFSSSNLTSFNFDNLNKTTGAQSPVISQSEITYQDFYKNIQNPSYLDVYKEIYKWIDQYFVSTGLAVPLDKIAKNIYTDLTYARVSDIYKASLAYVSNRDPRIKDSAEQPTGISVKSYTKLCKAVGDEAIPKITVERLANYIKAIFTLENKWQQFEPYAGRMIPSKNSDSSATGIGQMILGYHADNIEDAQRLCWDWRYNVEKSIEYFHEMYVSALQSVNPDISGRPWDWAVRGYNRGNFTDLNGALTIGYYTMWIQIFEGSVDTIKSSERKDAIFNAETAVANGPRGFDQAIHNYVQSSLTLDDKLKQANPQSFAALQLDQALSRQTYADGSSVLDAMVSNATQVAEEKRLLVHSTNPQDNYRDMYTDMVMYDQRGRMLRAFPTFQMFIVDEGRWMTSYKLWDNLYGFNSIQSIDVYKSRKIAADTCIIKMTNVYSNLTSRRLDADYGDWTYSFWDNMFWGNPSQSIIDARKDLVDSLMLETGARIHLRIGYGSDAGQLPVSFNGTITEMDTEDVVTIIAQGDGLELTNIISADPSETNRNVFRHITEPRDLLCKLMTSRGNWFKDVVNYVSGNRMFRDNPLGVQHFGLPGTTPLANLPFQWFNDKYGEITQNIYSSNGSNSFSQWTNPDGTPTSFTWLEALSPIKWENSAEAEVLMKLEGQTIWDIAQTLAYVSPDYIAAIHPFELRSTLFFGKPYYKLAYRYDSAYKWIASDNRWERTVTAEIRKPFMQYHYLDGGMDIVSNKIKASEDNVYTNVIATYEGGQSDLMMADWDIRFDKQRTQVVKADLVHRSLINFWTTAKQADNFAMAAVRDYVKDMYKGQLIILGDPTIKPYDMCYISDDITRMSGPMLVKEVTHSFSYETGFITSIGPDAVVINDDTFMLAHTQWLASFGIGTAAGLLGARSAAAGIRKIFRSAAFLKGKELGKWSGRALGRLSTYLPSGNENVKLFQSYFRDYLNVTQSIEEAKGVATELSLAKKADSLKGMEESFSLMKSDLAGQEAKGLKKLGLWSKKGVLSTTEGIIKGIKTGKNVFQFLETTAGAALADTGIGIIVDLGVTILAQTIGEMWKRYKKSQQCVLMIPLQYQGREFTAGINGHKGMVIGDKEGKYDQFFEGLGTYGGLAKVANLLLDDGTTQGSVRYSYSYDDIVNGKGPDGGL